MDDHTTGHIDDPPPAKRPYVAPRLHLLSGEDAEGKVVLGLNEQGTVIGPS
jgi:hypothetical protein